jgi:hypothetical protein
MTQDNRMKIFNVAVKTTSAENFSVVAEFEDGSCFAHNETYTIREKAESMAKRIREYGHIHGLAFWHWVEQKETTI